MKLSNILIGVAFADSEHSNNSEADVHNDIRLHRCQAKILEEQGYNVTGMVDSVSSESVDKCPGERAQAQTTKWNHNFSESENKYLVAYFFDSDHSEHEKTNIRNRMDSFGEETCVKMVEVDRNDATFANKLQVKKESGCWSYVGRWWAEQPLSLGWGCDTSSTPQHEVNYNLFHES